VNVSLDKYDVSWLSRVRTESSVICPSTANYFRLRLLDYVWLGFFQFVESFLFVLRLVI
jgi:hypothetical protein